MTVEAMQARRASLRSGGSHLGGLRLTAVLIALLAALTLAFAAGAQASSPGQLLIDGYNSDGQLGNGSLEEPASPFLVPGLSRTVTSAAGGEYDTYAVLANGQLEGWGYNGYGELGDGTNTERRSPVTISLPITVTDVSAGYEFAMALLSNGTVATWGHGNYGELGNGKTEESRTPIVVPGVEHVTAIAAGCYFGMALRSDGRVEAWGYGGYGELGDGKAEEHDSPIVIPGLENVVSIAASCDDSYAVLADGEVKAWGYNEYGELGDGSKTERESPIVIPGLSGVKKVSAGYYFAIALHTDGSLSGWGYNGVGELGDGTKTERLTPESLTNWPAGVSSISASVYDSYAILANGEPFGAGYNEYGELGDGTKTEHESPEDLAAFLPGVVAFGHGFYAYDLLAIQGAFANLSTSTLAFSNQSAGTASPPQSVALTNKGPAPLTISGDVLTGTGATAFTKSADGCQGVTVAAGESCTIAVAFTPGAPGTDAATLAVSSSAANALSTVSLSGTAPAPPVPAPVAPVLSGLALSHSLFRAASSGPTAAAALSFGAIVSYSDSEAATTTFTVFKPTAGVIKATGKSKRCVAAPKHAKRGAKHCTLYKALGTFSHSDAAGVNRIKFSGRLHNHKLPAGSYRLSAVAVLGPLKSAPLTKSFKIHH